ncbi:MAG: Ig-like domain-containing protein, partial [Thermoplasmata archaeon]|nr:Ig-like domain-containing protein [Thermoplasmata archaeon]
RIVLTGGPTPGSGGNNAEGGFNLNVSAGTLAAPGGPPHVQVNVWGNQSTHTTQGNDQRQWDVEWTAPGAGTGDVNFTVTAIAVNGDGSNVGDAWARFTVIVPEAGPVPPPTVDVIYPDGGEDLTGGSLHDIAYEPISSFPNDQLLIWINYSLDGGTSFTPIPGAQGIPGTFDHPNVFPWTLPVENSTQARVKVEVKDPIGVRGSDMSAADFEIDSASPQVDSASPTGMNEPITTNVLVRFSEGMNKTSSEAAFSLKDTATWTPVSGARSWTGNNMTFNPDASLQPGTEYQANVSVSASDDSDPGNYLEPPPYVWTFTTASGGDMEQPEISDVTAIPSPQEYPDNVNISAVIQDNVGVDHAWVYVTLPGGGSVEDPMSYDATNDRYYVNRSYPELGTYHFLVWAEDTSGLQNSSAGQFDMVDTTPPDIAHVPVSRALANDTINITATVTDNFALAQTNPVKLNYTNVTNSPFNDTMNAAGGDEYWIEIPAQLIEGTVTYFIWTTDTQGNEIRTDYNPIQVHWQDIFPPEILNVQADPSPQERYDTVNLSATVRDLSGVLVVRVTISLSGTEVDNRTMALGTNDVYYAERAYDAVGTYDFTIWAEDNNNVENSSSGHTFEIIDTTPPAKPTGLSVAAGDEAGTLDITWTANNEDDLAGYDLFRSDSVDGTYTKVNTDLITGTTYTDTGLEDNTTYYYKLKAVDDEGLESEFSDSASGTTITPGEDEEVDYTWLYALLGILIILVIILAVAFAMRKKPPEEEEEEELGELEEVGEEYSAEEGEGAAEEETAETSEE